MGHTVKRCPEPEDSTAPHGDGDDNDGMYAHQASASMDAGYDASYEDSNAGYAEGGW